MEHRWGRRVDCHIPVVVETGVHAGVRAQIQNLSLSGAFLEIVALQDLPPTVCVRFEPTNAAPYRRHRILGHVVRQTREGVGLEWTEFAPQVIHLHVALPPAELQAARWMYAEMRDRRLARDQRIS